MSTKTCVIELITRSMKFMLSVKEIINAGVMEYGAGEPALDVLPV